MHPDMGERDDDDVLRVLGLEMAEDAALVSGIGDFHDGLHRLDIVRAVLRPQIGDRGLCQFDFEW